jgi:hypothetical protein
MDTTVREFHDVLRHLVHNGPFASDTDRQRALSAVDEHEAQASDAIDIAHAHQDPPASEDPIVMVPVEGAPAPDGEAHQDPPASYGPVVSYDPVVVVPGEGAPAPDGDPAQ